MRLADGAANGDCLSYDSFSFDENGTAPAVALKGYDVLVEFLKTPSAAIDPVERIGDEVVTNAAARALASQREPHIFELVLWLAEIRPLPGVIAALGTSGDTEAIPLPN
jgi:hypothetical protein